MRPQPGLNARKTLAVVKRVLDAGEVFPSVDRVAQDPLVVNRGKASSALRELERCGMISRTGHGWATGSLHKLGRDAARVYAQNPDYWTPPGKKRARGVHPNAIAEGRTVYPNRVRENKGPPLRTGAANAKLGARVTKGRWKGAPILALSLEERKTCPTTCAVYDRCYGDNMGLAIRNPHGQRLEQRIEQQLGHLRPKGLVVVRLHELGDFYSVEYVEFWRRMLVMYPWLRVFGYTARQFEDPIGRAVMMLRLDMGSVFQIRTSGFGDFMAAYVVKPGEELPENSFACPEQSDRVVSCGACGACWSTVKNVVFKEH